MLGVTRSKIVGPRKKPSFCSTWRPSETSCAPSDWAPSMYSISFFLRSPRITGPRVVFGSVPGPTFSFGIVGELAHQGVADLADANRDAARQAALASVSERRGDDVR